MDAHPMSLDQFQCKLCRAREVGRTFPLRQAPAGTPFWGVTCGECGLFQVVYPWYAAPPIRLAEGAVHAMAYGEADLALSRQKADRFARLLDEAIGIRGKHVLEIGCGRGFFLAACLERGARRVTGSEFHAGDVAYAKDRLGLTDLRTVPFQDPRVWSAREFDVVVSLDVLEHVHDLRTFFEQMTWVTRAGGSWLHATPGYDAVTHELGRMLIQAGATGLGQQLCATVSYPTQLAEPGPHVQFLGRRQLGWLTSKFPLSLEWARYESAYSFDNRHYAERLPLLRQLPRALGSALFGVARQVVRNKLVFAAHRLG